MNVYRNVAFPLTVKSTRGHISKSEVKSRVARALAVVQLDHLADRQATDLSGGQQQRLALARALVLEPPLLLLDEPLSNLDAKLREEMRFELKRLQRELGITTVYVTHDQVEALSMSSVIAVLKGGHIEQIGKPRTVYEQPASRFVADFIGASNLVEATVQRKVSGDSYLLATTEGSVVASSPVALANGQSITLSIRPEYIAVTDAEPDRQQPGVWNGRVEARGFTGETMEYRIKSKTRELRVRTDAAYSIAPGTEVTMHISSDRCSIIPLDD
jgi:iron(III) transport system ATP-binding protein